MSIYAERSKRIITEGEINPKNMRIYNKYKQNMVMRGLSEKSIYNYEKDLFSWFRFLNYNQYDLLIEDVTQDDLEEYFFYRMNEGNNHNRIKRMMSSISAMYIFLRKKKLVQENPMEFIDRPKKGKPVTIQTYLTIEQVELMKQKLKENNDLMLETYALFSLSTMARVTAVSNTKWSQIDFEECVVNDVLEKGDKIVTLMFNEEVRDLLLKLKEERETNNIQCEYVFASKYKDKWDKVTPSTMAEWCKKIGKMIDTPLHCHDFRHSGATLLKNMGMPLEDVSEILNHASTETTRNFYIKIDNKKLKDSKAKYGI